MKSQANKSLSILVEDEGVRSQSEILGFRKDLHWTVDKHMGKKMKNFIKTNVHTHLLMFCRLEFTNQFLVKF